MSINADPTVSDELLYSGRNQTRAFPGRASDAALNSVRKRLKPLVPLKSGSR
jgi:hypothetical protein